MPTCSSCKHWGSGAFGDTPLTPFRYDLSKSKPVVSSRAEKEGWKACSRIFHFREPDDGAVLATVVDDDGYGAELYTSPKFHCAHWTTKEE